MYQVHNIQDKCTFADEHNFSEFDLAFQTQNNLNISKLVDFLPRNKLSYLELKIKILIWILMNLKGEIVMNSMLK